MTNSQAITETRPAKLSAPSDRDLEIFRHAEIHHRTHDAISLDFDVTRRRVGQIVQDVRRWLAIHGTTDPEINTDAQRQRQARGLERMRLEDVMQRAVHALNNAPLTLTTSTHVEHKLQTQYIREQPPVDHRILKTYLQAALALGKLEERKPLPAPPPAYEPCTDPKVQTFLTDWCAKNKIQWDTPEEYQDFVKQLTQTIRDGLAESSVGPACEVCRVGQACEASAGPPDLEAYRVEQVPACRDADLLFSFSPQPQATALYPQSTLDPFAPSHLPSFSPPPPDLNAEPRTLNPSPASPASLPEAPTTNDSCVIHDDLSHDSAETCDPPAASPSTPIPPPHPLKKTEKGSATRPSSPFSPYSQLPTPAPPPTPLTLATDN
jgi:hypothetical protein